MCKEECRNILGNKECIPYEQEIYVKELAQAYVPFQKFCSMLPPEKGFAAGTIFPELVIPDKRREKGGCI